VSITARGPHLARMEAFHRRHMVSNKILRLWARMVRRLPIRMILPQHGAPLAGPAVAEFIDRADQLECGIDLMGAGNCTVPA